MDEKGNPVPWVTVGASCTPYPSENKAGGFPRLQPKDLQRLISRNPESWEYSNRFVGPVIFLRFPGLTDSLGALSDDINYEDAARSPWPDELTVTYGAYRYGYEPTTATIKVHRRDRDLEVTLMMHPGKSFKAESPDYLMTYYTIRHELADWRRNEEVSWENHDRLEGMRKRLTEAAAAAAASGDRRAAAQIMYWVAFSPEVQVDNGKLVGFSQTNEESARNCLALKQAAEYDSDNAHVQAQYLLVQRGCWMAEQRRGSLKWDDIQRLRREWLDRAVALDRRAGSKLWPSFHNSLANTYGFFDMEKERIEKLEWLRNYEPAWRNAEYYDSAIRIAKERMARAAQKSSNK